MFRNETMTAFANRAAGGRALVAKLAPYARRPDGLVLALPRGGVPVAYEVAAALELPMDVFLVRKLGVPGHEELALGAIASGGVTVLNEDVIQSIGISQETIRAVQDREMRELARRAGLYRGDRPTPPIRGRTLVLVDDGLATGATMRAAVQALQSGKPARIIVATPVASPQACAELAAIADECVCVATPEPFVGVGRWYQDFEQIEDDEVHKLLNRSWHRSATPPSKG